MPKEDLTQEEEVKTKPTAESESEDSEDLENIFEDDSQEEPEDKSDEISELKKQVADLTKGMAKAFSDKGRESKDEPKEEKKADINSVIKNLYFKANPEAQGIWEEVEKTAKEVGKDPFELYESSTYLKGEAKARAEEKKVEEESKSKISKPSNDVDFSKKVSSIKEEDIHKLTPAQKVEWIKAQAEKETNNTD